MDSPINHAPRIKSPYDNWDSKRLVICLPVKKRITHHQYFECSIYYNYSQDDNIKTIAPLYIQLPNNDERCTSPYGTGNMDHKSSDQKNLRLICKIDPGQNMMAKVCNIFRDIYEECLIYMEKHDKNGTKLLSNKKIFTKPQGIINQNNTADHLKYPIFYTTRGEGAAFSLNVKNKGRQQSQFFDIGNQNQLMNIDQIYGTPIEHIPTIHIPGMIISDRAIISMILHSTFINKISKLGVLSQGKTLEYLKNKTDSCGPKIAIGNPRLDSIGNRPHECSVNIPNMHNKPQMNIKDENDDTDNTCKICFDAESSTAIIPCGHKEFCFMCINKYFNSTVDKKCPICRTNMTVIVQFNI
jgi:hypothetical protein